MYLAGATSLLFMGLPERVGYLGLAAAALYEEELDDLAELVCCTAALWEQWAATVVPGAPPDLAARGRVWRLLNQAQANIVLA
jgi:hypothetical protein